MKKKKLKAKLLQAEEERRTALVTKHKVLKEVRTMYNSVKELQHYIDLPSKIAGNESVRYCSGCMAIVSKLREVLAPYQMDFMMEDHYLPALQAQMDHAQKMFFPETTKTFHIQPWDWKVNEQEKSKEDNT